MNGKVFKISNDMNADVFVGSTSNSLSSRFWQIRQNAKLNKPGKLYDMMRELGESHFRMDPILEYDCETKEELLVYENQWIDELKPTLNEIKVVPDLEARKAAAKAYREQNVEKIKACQQKYRVEHAEKIAAAKKKYKENHAAEIAAQAKAYREKNAEAIRLREKEYREKNAEAIKQKKKEYREKNAEALTAKAKARWQAKIQQEPWYADWIAKKQLK